MDTTVGRYHIEQELGRGGMGIVYRAHDPVIDRVVALKTIRNSEGLAAATYAELRERFLREAKAAGRLQHPNIVAVLDAGTDEATGISYIAMELVEGRDLEGELKAGRRFTAAEAAEIVAAVAEGLDYAHEHGVVHRDVKPANILLDGNGRVRITDFGIAHLAESGLTRAGQVLGSPAYMSPEQITGAELDRKSDIFSLGVVLYQLLTGERPFLGEGLSTLAYQIVHTEPIPARKLNPSLPPAHEGVLRRALAKTPADRYARAGDMAMDLRGQTEVNLTTVILARGVRATTLGETPPPAASATGTLVSAPPLPRSATGTILGAPVAPAPGATPRSRPIWLVPVVVGVVAVVATAVVLSMLRAEGLPPTTPVAVATATATPQPTDPLLATPAVAVLATPSPLATPTPPPPKTTSPAKTPSPRKTVATKATPAAVVPTATAHLLIDFEHNLVEGTLWLRTEGQDVWTTPLRAVAETRDADELRFPKEVIARTIDVPAGAHRFSVTVIAPKKKVDDTAHANLDLAAGASGYLRIRVKGHNIELRTTR